MPTRGSCSWPAKENSTLHIANRLGWRVAITRGIALASLVGVIYTVAGFRRKTVKHTSPLPGVFATWTAGALVDLTDAEHKTPEILEERAVDGRMPLFAIADPSGGGFPQFARDAALDHAAGKAGDDDGLGVRLLTDVRGIFEDIATDRLPSAMLTASLAAISGAPWGAFGKRGGPIDARSLASLLLRYEIKPKQIRIGTETLKGYMCEAFADSFARYLPARERTENIRSDLRN